MNNIEKENEQLKEAAKLAADASFKLSEQVYNLKAENERLKGIIDFWQKNYADADAENTELKAENERLKQQLAEIGKSWDEIQRLRKENKKLLESEG